MALNTSTSHYECQLRLQGAPGCISRLLYFLLVSKQSGSNKKNRSFLNIPTLSVQHVNIKLVYLCCVVLECWIFKNTIWGPQEGQVGKGACCVASDLHTERQEETPASCPLTSTHVHTHMINKHSKNVLIAVCVASIFHKESFSGF